MKKILLFLCFQLSFSCLGQDDGNILLPQNRKSSNPFERFTLGGNVGVAFGSNLWGVSIAPRVGYKATDNLELAFSVDYNYQSGRYLTHHFIGIGPSVNYYFARSGYVAGSFQHYFIQQKWDGDNASYRSEEDALYLGGGYMQSLGGNTYLRIGGSYNVLYNKDKSIFGSAFSPEIGIVIGL